MPYTYDGLDRIATRNGQAFSYAGSDIDPIAQGSWTFSRSPAGRLLALSDGPNDLLAGLNRHGDLNYLFSSSGAVSDTRVYDPFGSLKASTGSTAPPLGFQADFTDPASKHVWMGARWYDGSDANFLSRDSYSGELKTPVSLNHYTYANANPLAFFDPDGHRPADPDGPNETTGSAARAAGDTAAAQTSRGQQRIPKPAGWASWTWEQRKYWVAGHLGGDYLDSLVHKNRSTWGFFAKALFSTETLKEGGRASLGFLKGVGDVAKGVAHLAGGVVNVALHPEKAIARVGSIYQKQGVRGLLSALDRNFNPIHALRASATAYVTALRSGDYESAGRAGVALSVQAGSIVAGGKAGVEFLQKGFARVAARESLLVEGELGAPLVSQGGSPTFAVASNGEALALNRITISGPVNAAQGKIDFLMGRVSSAKSASRGEFFARRMGFDDASLDAALRQHLVENFQQFPAEPALFPGELGRLRINAPMTGPSGMTSKVSSIWALLKDGQTSLITAW